MRKTNVAFSGPNLKLLASALGAAAVLGTTVPAAAEAVPECGNLRFEGLANCEVSLNAECNASCSKLGIYKVRCATELVPVCDQTCTLTAEVGCSDTCNTQCKSDCDNGVNVICAMNCFDECTVGRDAKCVTVDGGCYQHCIECCDGSCTADANMDCQTTCQNEKFETCEHEFQAECDASCSVDGALFCDGVFVIAGSQIPSCIAALAAKGLEVNVEANLNIGPDGITGDITGGLCTYSPKTTAGIAAPVAAIAAAAAWVARRRRRPSASK